MAFPDLVLKIEPLLNNKVTYAPLSAPRSGSGFDGINHLYMRILIANEESQPVELENVEFTFQTPPGSWSVGDSSFGGDGIVIPPGDTVQWNSARGQYISFLDIETVLMTARLSFKGFTDPRITLYKLKPHVNPVKKGAYLFPAYAEDLRPDEFWVGQSGHAAGNKGSQLYAHDLGVEGFVSSINKFTATFSGKIGTKNEDFRTWELPIYAMADGVVHSFNTGVIDNPEPGEFPDSFAKTEDRGGNHFVIRHGDELVLYAHLKKNSLNPDILFDGAVIKAGDFLGLVGNSGSSSHPHLHIHATGLSNGLDGAMRPILFREIYFLGKTHLIMPIGDSPWIKAKRKVIPNVLTLIWPSSMPQEGWRVGEVEIGPEKFWEWPFYLIRIILRFPWRLFR